MAVRREQCERSEALIATHHQPDRMPRRRRLSQMPLVRADEYSEECKMGSESSHSIERPPRLVPLGKVLAIASFSLSLAAWLYTPGGVFLIIAEFVRPMLSQYTGAVFGSAMPLAGVALGLWASWCGRRECGTFWFVIALASVFVSGNLVIANFAIPIAFGGWK